MFSDPVQWQRIRTEILINGVSRREMMRRTGLCWQTIAKIVAYESPPGYRRKSTAHRSENQKKKSGWDDVIRIIVSGRVRNARQMIAAIQGTGNRKITSSKLKELRAAVAECGVVDAEPRVSDNVRKTKADHDWLARFTNGRVPIAQIEGTMSNNSELKVLYEKAKNGKLSDRRKAISILAWHRGIKQIEIAKFLQINRNTVLMHLTTWRRGGVAALFAPYKTPPRKAKEKDVRNQVFRVLHTPPSDHGLNRTSWRMVDLKMCLARHGLILSKDVIREVIRDAGYRWKKARVVLTSNDPEYREKLHRIKRTLSLLKADERFFSIDEFGPFSVKMRPGRRLAAPDEQPSVPQFQRSKGCLIVTSALELSTNQVTHFYSKRKNTTETTKLLAKLLKQYKDCRKLYVTWDAASWHDSKTLWTFIEENNARNSERKRMTPHIEVVPLPARAQYLNVIESVFSGMARAIIHNSNYSSAAAARVAIDRYFQERNENFLQNPKRAGNKLWKLELVPSEFDEAQNCKDPRW